MELEPTLLMAIEEACVKDSFEMLLQFLHDELENLRALAAWLLGEWGDIRATDFLLAAQELRGFMR